MRYFTACMLLVLACGKPKGHAKSDGGVASDSGSAVDRDAATGADAGAFDPGPVPSTSLPPKPGELSFYQLELPPGLTQRMGESSIIVGPDGSIALLDIGNSTHDDEVRDALLELNTQWITPANGFQAREPLQVDWIIITQVHGDHVGAFQDLLMGGDPLTGLKGIVHRGFVDLGDGMNTADFEQFCSGMNNTYAEIDRPLCASSTVAGCDYEALVSSHEATGCPDLLSGNLATSDDDAEQKPAFIDLGEATITFVAANAHFSDGQNIESMPAFGHDTGDEENARSLVGVVSFGNFRYHFGSASGTWAHHTRRFSPHGKTAGDWVRGTYGSPQTRSAERQALASSMQTAHS